MRFTNTLQAALLLWCLSVPAQAQHYIQVKNPAELKAFFRWTPDRIPLSSAHRGGPAAGYPENCLETFAHTLQQTFTIIECDPQLTKDSIGVMMHDYTLDRTTNGRGKLSDYTYAQLQELRLKDNEGNLTDFRIPTLEAVIKWARNKTILTVDIKKTISPEYIERLIRENEGESYVAVITSDLETAKKYHALNKNLLISVTVRNKEEYERLAASGIPFSNTIAFTGTTEPDPAVYRLLHDQGVYCILGTMGNLDKSAAARQSNVYARLVHNGADILATDFPVDAAAALKDTLPGKSTKSKFFVSKKEAASKSGRRKKVLDNQP
jgi:glycerophosphoryl diester phosphodiesterase